jgi:RIO kinase 1
LHREDFEEEGDAFERRREEKVLIREKDIDQIQTIEEVFDGLTLRAILKLIKRGTIQEIHGVVNAGKEGRIYWGLDSEGVELAIKIYYTKTGEFRRGMIKYIEGDPRFERFRRSNRGIIYTWAQKEFKNLQLVEKAGVSSPRPMDVYRNVLVMTFIGSDGVPAPLLKELPPSDPVEFYDKILKEVHLMYNGANLIHGDLSEYNIMNWEEAPILFDLSQAVLRSHPLADELLQRDLKNLNRYFRRRGVETLEEERLERWVKNGEEDINQDT